MRTKQQVLILFAHPFPNRSRVNRKLIEAVRDLDNVLVHDLYETYPDFLIDVNAEQALLLRVDSVVFQYPIYWYSSPPILKEWRDVVLASGFAYGEGGSALRGKTHMLAVTTGGRADSYGPQGTNRYPLEVFLRPFEQSAYLCGMRYLPPFVVYGTREITDEAIHEAAQTYRERIRALVRGEQ
jgi:glutathione-regulated potassium-efflux system ancillary protein KefG